MRLWELGLRHYPILGNFPEKAKLDEIAKYSHFDVKPMCFGEDGLLKPAEITKPAPAPRSRRRF